MIPTAKKNVRSFIAIPVPEFGIHALEEAVDMLEPEIGRYVRWVRPEGIHLTLKFMGEIPIATVEKVLKSLLPETVLESSPFPLAIKGFGVFPNPRRPRVLWAGLDGDLETLSKLQLVVDDAVGMLGLPKEQRTFSPHLTLGRVRRDVSQGELLKIGELMSSVELPPTLKWTADIVNLMRTELEPGGSRHYLVGSATIGGR